VRVSFDSPEYTADIAATGTVRLLEAIRETGLQPRFYQASSSEMYGMVREVPQTERTPFYPRSPYGCAKVFSYWITVNYRESYGLHASNGILFNHESPRRGETFVTRKITRAIAQIRAGLQDKLFLGNLDAKRDWGYAKEFVEAMWLMLQQDKADDYVIATNETHSVREFLEAAFGHVGLDWKKYVEIDPRYYRPAEVELLIGDYSKAKRHLGWEPKTRFVDTGEADGGRGRGVAKTASARGDQGERVGTAISSWQLSDDARVNFAGFPELAAFHSTGDDEGLAGNVAGEGVGGEENRGVGDVVGPRELGQGHGCRDFADGGGGPELRGIPGHDGPARADAIDPPTAVIARMGRDPDDSVFQRTGQAAGNGGFAGGIIGVAGFAKYRGSGRDEDGIAALLLRDQAEEFPQAQERGGQDAVERASPLAQRHLVQGHVAGFP